LESAAATLPDVRVAVVGAGVVGLSVTADLLSRQVDVTCYERADAVMSERSAGSSRIFRLAHTRPELVRLAQRAQAGFRCWGQSAGARLVGAQECVLSTPDLPAWASAMAEAGAPHEIVDGPSRRLRLPAVAPPVAALVDPSGGVIDVDAVRGFLAGGTGSAVVHEPVYAIEDGPSAASVWSPGGAARFDAVLLAAGAGTLPLGAQVGIYPPSTLSHHVRFTFPVDRSVRWQCWIDKPVDGVGTYQHQSGPGRWSVGGHVDPVETVWEVGRDAATDASREALLRYARERLLVEPRIVESLYCTHVPDLGDGFTVHRSGRVLAVSGENLFKFAPVLGEALASACVDGSTPSMEGLAA
jgi:sarcosine oxidase